MGSFGKNNKFNSNKPFQIKRSLKEELALDLDNKYDENFKNHINLFKYLLEGLTKEIYNRDSNIYLQSMIDLPNYDNGSQKKRKKIESILQEMRSLGKEVLEKNISFDDFVENYQDTLTSLIIKINLQLNSTNNKVNFILD